MAKMWNVISSNKIGLPLSSLRTPKTVVEAANATFAMSIAKTKHALEVLMSHLLPLLPSFLCVFVKHSSGVWPLLLYHTKKFNGMDSFAYCSIGGKIQFDLEKTKIWMHYANYRFVGAFLRLNKPYTTWFRIAFAV